MLDPFKQLKGVLHSTDMVFFATTQHTPSIACIVQHALSQECFALHASPPVCATEGRWGFQLHQQCAHSSHSLTTDSMVYTTTACLSCHCATGVSHRHVIPLMRAAGTLTTLHHALGCSLWCLNLQIRARYRYTTAPVLTQMHHTCSQWWRW